MPERPKRKTGLGWATALAGVVAGSLGGILFVRRVLPDPRPADVSGRGSHAAAPSSEAVADGYETDQANAGVLTQVIAGWGVLVVGLIFGMVFLQRYLEARQIAAEPGFTAQETASITPPKPNLQANPLGEIAALRAREIALLSNYAWADPDHAHARIPIGRAIELTVGKTLDTVP